MRDGGAHLRPAVLEHEHVADLGPGEERGRPFGPEVDDGAHPGDAQAREGADVLGGVEHDLRGATRGTGGEGPVAGTDAEVDRRPGDQRRPPVLERAHGVGGRRLDAADAEGAAAGREVGTALAVTDDPDPLPGQPVEPQLGLAHVSHSRPCGPGRSGPARPARSRCRGCSGSLTSPTLGPAGRAVRAPLARRGLDAGGVRARSRELGEDLGRELVEPVEVEGRAASRG